MKRLISVDSYNRRLVTASSWATAGNYPLFMGGDWVQVLDESADDSDIGSTARLAFAACREGMPEADPRSDPGAKRRRDEFYKAAGAKSIRQFARQARHVSVYWNDAEAEMEVAPHRSIGAGFEGIPGKISIPADSSDEELGTAIRQALSVSVAFVR